PRSLHAVLMIEGSKLTLVKYRFSSTGVQFDSLSVLPVSGTTADISPDGSLIAYSDLPTRSFWTYRLSDGAKTQIATISADENFGTVRFARDNSALVYRVNVFSPASTRYYRAALAG